MLRHAPALDIPISVAITLLRPVNHKCDMTMAMRILVLRVRDADCIAIFPGRARRW